MNKKLLSVILSGVLMVISAGVFVSCEDYDDDISNLQTQINDLGSTLTALQSQVQAGKWITSVSSTTGGLTIVFSDGTQYTIENGKDGAPGAPGKDGNGTLVEVKDGYWYLNGEKTDYLALTKEDKVPVPYVNEEDGYWYFYNEEGEAVKSEYKALGATYAVKDANTGVWTLHVPDADGTMQSIDLPTAAAKITGLTFVNSTEKVLTIYATKGWKFTDVDKKTGLTASTWAGPKKPLPKDGDVIYGSTDAKVFVQVSPADVAKDIENYTLTDSKNATLGLALTAEPFNELVYRPNNEVSKTKAATNGNGLYNIMIAPQVVSKANAEALGKVLKAANDDHIGYALVADNVFRSAYEVTITTDNLKAPILDQLKVNEGSAQLNNDDITVGSTSNDLDDKDEQIKVGTTYTVTFSDPAAVYDSYFEFLDTDISTFGITYDNESKTFSISKNPDVSSLTGQFTMTVYTVDINGNVHKTEITFHLAAEMANNMLAAQTVDVSKDKPAFQYNLSDVAITGTDQWKQNVNLTAEYALYEDKDCTPRKEVSGVVGTGKLIDPAVVNAKGTAAANADEATKVVFTIDNDNAATAGLTLNTTYYLKTTFKTKGANPEVLNTVILPVMFTAPALEDLFVPAEPYVVDGVINAYFYKGDDGKTPEKSVDLNKYFDKSVDDAEVSMENKTNIATKGTTKYTSKTLTTSPADKTPFNSASVKLNEDVTKDNGYELGYGEALIVTATKDNYKGWKYKAKSGDDTYSFKIRLMSPIMEGSIKAVGDVITLPANDLQNGAKITDEMIKGYTYNNVAYNVVPDAIGSSKTTPAADWWANPQIANVEMDPKDVKYLKKISDPQPATMVDGKQVNGYFKVTAESVSNTTETVAIVTVTDIWGYTKESEVKVRITVGE